LELDELSQDQVESIKAHANTNPDMYAVEPKPDLEAECTINDLDPGAI